ncbi:MAG: type II secretion system GspH family protein [Candidatus Sumerlaeia bacterium]|nr:type II secretion system GspH family protein [Candidatus Sumerlaeia bacterium]
MKYDTPNIRKNKAVTLIEILAVLVIGGMILGLLLEIFIATNTAVKKKNIEAIMLQEATLIAQKLEQVLTGYVPPERVKTATGKPEFKDATLTVFWMLPGQIPELRLATFKTVKSKSGEETRVMLIDKPATATSAHPEESIILGSKEARISTTIEFAYAREFNNLEARWVPELAETQSPVLIRWKITVNDSEGLVKPLVLISAKRIIK